MRNSLLAALLAMLAGNALAEWTVVDAGDTQTFYADLATIRNSANTTKMWMVVDFVKPWTTPAGKKYLSQASLFEFDCTEQRARMLQSSMYSAQMGRGNQVFSSSDPWNWEYIQPGTVKAKFITIACRK